MRYLLIFFLGIVCLGMVITLAPIPTGDSSRMQTDVLAEVGGAGITTQDLYRSIQSRLRGSPMRGESRMVGILAKPVLDEMVSRTILVSQAKKLGLQVSDEELSRTLQTIPWLYASGSFPPMEQYQSLVEQQTGMTVSQFEAQFREEILLDKMRAVVADGLQVTPAEIHDEFLRRNAKARIEYVVLDPSHFLKAVQVNDQALEAFFKQDQARYKVQEQRRVRYVLIEPERLASQIKVSDEGVRQYYSQHLSDYRVRDRVKVAHILFKTMGKKPEEVAVIEKKAQDVLSQLKSGADFGELAKKYSEDSSASKGGELDWIVHGQTVKEFDQAAFSLKPGQISDLIRTTYGVHILKVHDKQTAHLQTLAEVGNSIRAELGREKLASAGQSRAAELEKQLNANPQGFEAVARQAGLEPKETPLFRYNQAVPDLGNNENFQNLAFGLSRGKIGSPVTVPKGLAIIQVTEIVPEHAPKLEEVRARVEEDYRAEQSKALALAKARDFAAKCKTGGFKKLAKEAGLEVKVSKDFAREDNVEDLGPGSQLETAFTLAPGQTSDALSLGQNNVVCQVMSHTPPQEADFAAQQDRISEELLNQKRNLAFEIYRQSLKAQLLAERKLKLNDTAMKQFLAPYQKQ